MQVSLHAQGVALPRNSRRALVRRISLVLERFAHGVARLHVSLKDVNGPRGGRDKVCILRAELASGGAVVVIDRSEKMRRAITRCLRRARLVITRESRKRRRLARRGASRVHANEAFQRDMPRRHRPPDL